MPKFIQNGIKRLRGARRKLATCAIGAMVCLLVVHVVFGANGLRVYQQKRAESQRLQEQIEMLRRQNEALDHHIKALTDDPQAIEKEAREKLRYVRPGEAVYTIPSPPPATAGKK